MMQTSPDENTASPDIARIELFRKQKRMLDTFLSTGAIDQRQHDKSLACLAEKMGINPDEGKQP